MNTGRKTQWGSISLLLLLFMISLNLHSIILNPVDLQAPNNNESDRTLKETITISDYSPDFTSNGEDCNVTLQQSLINTSPITISNSSDPENNTFYEPCPTTENFPSSFVNMTIEDIYAPNKTIIIEDEKHQNGFFDFTNVPETAASFQVKSSCYLRNVSVFLYHDDPGTENATVRFLLYNSTWDSINNRSIPGANNDGYVKDLGTTQFDESFTWVNLTCSSEVILNNSKTDNNTWFIGLVDINPQHARWAVTEDIGIAGDASDDSDCYTWLAFPPPGEWILAQSVLSRNIDFPLKFTVTPYISPPNQTLIVEDSTINSRADPTTARPCATSFQINGDKYLENVSVRLYTDKPGTDNEIKFVLYNSSWDSSNSVSIPGGNYFTDYINLGNINFTANGLVRIIKLNEFLNNSKTDNNTWFIGIWDVDEGRANAQWYYTVDGGGDSIDETQSYKWHILYEYWEPVRHLSVPWEDYKVDFQLKLDFRPPNNNPNPESINLKVNNIAVHGILNEYGTGYWSSIDEYSSLSGRLGFTLSADWWDVSCTITSVQIVYTKTDGKADSAFTVVSNQEVVWNVTDAEELNYLDARINETAMINFTIPASWYNINVFNGTQNKTDYILIRSLSYEYSEICVLNAGSGDWYLTASSENLVASIDSYLGCEPENVFNYSDIAHFNVSFKDTIFQNDGLINLSIYSPAPINDVLNFTLIKTTFNSGQEFSLGDWDVSDTVIQYGVFRVQVSWHNGTAVGFLEVSLTIIGESNLLLIKPPQNTIFDPDKQFTIIVYYEDTQLHEAIDGAVIEYNIAAQGWETTTLDNGTSGFYLIPVDCSELSSSGSKRVELTATREFYSTSTLEYIFEISESASTATTTSTTTQSDTSTSTTTATTTSTPQSDTSTSATTTTTTMTITETGTFPGLFIILTVFGTLVMVTRRRKKV